MSHQVIITFDLDENRITENAEKEAGRQIAKKIIETLNGNSYYVKDNGIRTLCRDVLKEMIGDEKDEIIAEAVHEIVGNLHRTKAVKEMLESAT